MERPIELIESIDSLVTCLALAVEGCRTDLAPEAVYALDHQTLMIRKQLETLKHTIH